MARSRSASNEFLVYSAETALGWRIIRRCSFETGEHKVELGIFVRVFDEAGKHVGYQPTHSPKSDKELPSAASTPSLTRWDAERIAGSFGRSRTLGLDEDERMERVEYGLSPEDAVERSIEKVTIWTQPAPGRGDRAVRVYPKGPAK